MTPVYVFEAMGHPFQEVTGLGGEFRPVARGGGGGSEESYPLPPPLTAEGSHFGHTSSTRGMNPFLELS